jgi:hypothetical protein
VDSGGEGYFGYGVEATERYVAQCEAAFTVGDLESARQLVDALSELAPCYRDRPSDLEVLLSRLDEVSSQFPDDPWIALYLSNTARHQSQDWQEYRRPGSA